jgi:CheY-like chemotaxis protein
VWTEADPVRLTQVIGNLVSNASRYSDPESEISLRAESSGGDIRISVKDHGIGIPPDKLESIFEMFSQIDRSLERTTGGLGIGLYLVKRLVELHGGTVTAHSEGPGRGSEFVVRLPAAPGPLSVVGAMPRPELPVTPSSGPCLSVLVVDDNKDAATTMVMLLRAQRYVTQTAHDGLQALEAAERFNPDVVLLDIGLPGLNGYEVCQRIRQQPWGREMIVIALTGWGQEQDKRRADECGFDAHLVKPVEVPKLMELMASLLKQPDPSEKSGTSDPSRIVTAETKTYAIRCGE